MFIEPCKTELLSNCIDKANESGKNVKLFTEEAFEYSAENKFVIYSGEKYVCIYANTSGEHDFEINGKKTFYEMFTDKEITFPYYMNKGECILIRK